MKKWHANIKIPHQFIAKFISPGLLDDLEDLEDKIEDGRL